MQACAAATRTSSPTREVSIGINYSPWQHIYPENSDPRNTSKDEEEHSRISTNARRFLGYLASANKQLGTNVKVGLVMLDSETFRWNESSPADWVAAVTQKHELAHSWTRQLFPAETRVMYFAYGMAYWSPSRQPVS